jgi:ATP-binding cassette subfamily B protein
MSETEKKTGNVIDYKLLKRIFLLAMPYRKIFYTCIGLSILLSFLAPTRPILISFAINHYIIHHDIRGLFNISIALVLLLMTETTLRYFFTYQTEWLGQSVIKDLRVKIYHHIINLRLRFFDKTPIGTATTRTINDMESINEIFAQGSISIVADMLMIVVIVAIMIFYDWKLAIASLSTLPLFIYATYRFKENIKVAFQKVRTEVARLNAFLQEHISGVKIIQLFNANEREFQKFTHINESHMQAHIDSIWHYAVFFPIVEILSTISVSCMIGVGSFLMINGALDINKDAGNLTMFILLINMLYRPLRMLADKFNTLQMGMVAGERVFEIIDKQDHIPNDGTVVPETLLGEVEFKNVCFSYNDSTPILKDISFTIPAGKALALVGATGSGKTSTLAILSRFYEFSSGDVFIDQIKIQDYDLFSLRRKMAVVLQDVFLFKGSIYENITMGDASITLDQVIYASKLLGLHDFIMTLPDGYMYEVKERGATLSVGQRQLISFVRALVIHPSILILDEATSSVDSESEILIQRAIDTLVKGRTSIIVAHRLSTIKHADKILVFDQGKIIESGNHQELLAQNGHYKKLYEMQFSKENEDSKN